MTEISNFDEFFTPYAVIASIIAVVLVVSVMRKHPLEVLPGPVSTSIIFGHVSETLGSVSKWHEDGQFPEPFLSWVKQYGGAVHYRELFDHLVLLTDPVALKHVLVANGSNYPRHPAFRSFFANLVMGKGLVSSEGAQHDAQRKMLNPLFSHGQVKEFVTIFSNHANDCCESILAIAAKSSEQFDLADVMQEMTLRIIGLAGFGFEFESHPEAHAAYKQLQLQPSSWILLGIMTIPGFADLPIPALRTRNKAKQSLRAIMTMVIEHKLTTDKQSKTPDLLDLILPTSSTDDALVHTMTFMFAGHETTSTTLTWVLATLATRPDIVKILREEFDCVAKKHGNVASSWEAVAELTFTNAVIQETLRLNPVVYQLVRRQTVADDNVPMSDGSTIFLPKGTIIDMNMAAMHRNPLYWTSPDEFIPQRFLLGTSEASADLALRDGKPNTFVYFPFSRGSKNCIGLKFAMMEMQVIVATLVNKFDFILMKESNLRHKFNGATLQPTKVLVSVKYREAALVI